MRSLVERNGGRVGELACSQHLRAKPMLLELLDESANEYYLFHGAHRLLAVGIANGCRSLYTVTPRVAAPRRRCC